MDRPPRHPRDPSRQLPSTDDPDGRRPTDRGQLSLVAVAEHRPLVAREVGSDRLGPRGRRPGSLPARPPERRHRRSTACAMSPITKTSGGPGPTGLAPTDTRPARSSRHAEHRREGRRLVAGAPRRRCAAGSRPRVGHDARRRRWPSPSSPSAHVDAEPPSWRSALCDSSLRDRRTGPGRSASIRMTFAVVGSIVRKSRAIVWQRDLGDRARHLDAGRSAADDHEGQVGARSAGSSARARRVRRRAGCGGGSRVRPPGVFSPGALGCPLVVAEVGVRRAGGEDQVVETDGRRRRRGHRLASSMATTSASSTSTFGWRGQHRADRLRRCRPATARPSPPGRATAGTGGGCAGRRG